MTRGLGWIDDRMNPIVVKELRQAVRGRFVAALLVVLLLIQLGVLTVFLLTSEVETFSVVSTQGKGPQVFSVLHTFMLLMAIVVMPLYVAVRLFVERANESLSLLFISTLPPRRVVSGKLLATQLLVLLLMSACLPFVSFTYFMRGIDLPSIFVAFLAGFTVSCVCTQAMILLACFKGSRFFKLLVGAGGLIGLFIVYGVMVQFCTSLVSSGVGSRIDTRQFWLQAGAFAGSAAFLLGLFFLASVALVSPPAANRAWPVRLYLSGTWLASAVTAGVVTLRTSDRGAAEAWLVVWTLVIAAAFVVAVSSRDRMSVRVAREVPEHLLKRAGAFYLWSGSANGMAWAVALAIATMAAALVFDAQLSGPGIQRQTREALGFLGYGFAYCVSALLLHRRFLAQRVPHRMTWLLTALLVAVGSLLPLVVGLLLSPQDLSRTNDEWQWWFLNPMSPFERDFTHLSTPLALGWAGVMGAMALPWFTRQVKAFGRAES